LTEKIAALREKRALLATIVADVQTAAVGPNPGCAAAWQSPRRVQHRWPGTTGRGAARGHAVVRPPQADGVCPVT
jgi:hypothetical protein